MANPAPSGTDDYNTKIIEEFRANGGRVGGPWAGITLILIHHTGAKSGIERVSPVAYSLQGDSRFAIWAANGGSPAHPNWYFNLKANPRIKAEVGTQTFTALAEELDDTALPMRNHDDREQNDAPNADRVRADGRPESGGSARGYHELRTSLTA